MKILGIETSCDETAIAIYDENQGLIADSLYSQVDLHKQYGGVVPELASRDHGNKILPLIDKILTEANCSANNISAIAYTKGPGLIGALLVGASAAKSLSLAWDVPAIGINHLEGHLLAPLLEAKTPKLPFIGLLVSGGHTMLVLVNKIGEYELLGESVDDAAGEAFDKTAKIMGLSYPGGPKIAKLAENGIKDRFVFPRPMLNRPGLDFSFSGLKTHALNTINSLNQNLNEQDKADIALAFEEAVGDTLTKKAKRAIEQTGIKQLVVAGGVSANLKLRAKMDAMMEKVGGEIYYPRLKFCTDNAAMIALAGFYKFKTGVFDKDFVISAKPRWPLHT